jgi:hypothetical protein
VPEDGTPVSAQAEIPASAAAQDEAGQVEIQAAAAAQVEFPVEVAAQV